MKKLFAILLVALLTLSLAACGGNTDPDTSSEPDNSSSEPSDNANDAAPVADSALDLLTTVWNSYKEDDKFAIVGGDLSEENMTPDAPGKFSLDDADALDNTMAYPAASVDKIDDAAAIRHMLNANTFTCGAYHVKDANEIDNVVSAIKDTIKNRHWICGFPEKVVIVTVGDYVVALFGAEELTNVFTANLTAAYEGAETVCNEAVM